MQGSSGDSKENIDRRISEDAAKTLQNVLNSVRVSLEDEFAIQQMEYDELYGVGSEEFERYQVQVGQWLKENRLVDSVVDMLPLSVFMNRRPEAQSEPDPIPESEPEPEPGPAPETSPWSGPATVAQTSPIEPQAQPQPQLFAESAQGQQASSLNSYQGQSDSYANLAPPPITSQQALPATAFAPPPSSPSQPDLAQIGSPAGLSQNLVEVVEHTVPMQQYAVEEQTRQMPQANTAEFQAPPEAQPPNPWLAQDSSEAPVAQAETEAQTQWSQPQWNSAIESVQEAQDGFESGGWAAIDQGQQGQQANYAAIQNEISSDTISVSSPEQVPAQVPAQAPALAPPPFPDRSQVPVDEKPKQDEREDETYTYDPTRAWE